MKKQRKEKLVGIWCNQKEIDKLKKIQDKLRTRTRVATIRELIRKERV